MTKKKAAWGIFLAVVLAACIAVMVSSMEEPLGREKDTEFASGSQIQIDRISDVQEESLYKLCKVWGYAKYRHPSVVDGSLNWDAELFRVLPEVLQAETGEAANQAMSRWLNQFPFDWEATETDQAWAEVQEEFGDSTVDAGWIGDNSLLGGDLCGYLERLSKVQTAERSHGYASFSDKEPYVSFQQEVSPEFRPEDDGVKLLALFRFWNIYEYYSPNVQITKKDWDAVLRESIPRVLAAEDYRSYVLAIAEAAAQTGDAHITVSDKEHTLRDYFGKYSLQCSVKSVDGRIVIAQTAEGEGELRCGDVIEAVDGVSMADRIADLSRYTVLPEEDKIIGKMGSALLKTENETAQVQVLRGNERLTVRAKTSRTPYQFQNPYANGLLEQWQIGYIDPSALKDGQVEKLMEEFAETKGIIVDLRRYPSVFLPYLLGEYITPEPKQFAALTFPNRAMPGSFYRMDNFVTGAGTMASQGDKRTFPHYPGKVILLMDETSMSQSEFTVMALRQSPNAVVVGSPSIGADGNVVGLSLPGRIGMSISGLGVYTPEGGQTQRIGLEPDVQCLPTVEGLRDGRDELVEKAVELILQ